MLSETVMVYTEKDIEREIIYSIDARTKVGINTPLAVLQSYFLETHCIWPADTATPTREFYEHCIPAAAAAAVNARIPD
jgi:hypothetical protein